MQLLSFWGKNKQEISGLVIRFRICFLIGAVLNNTAAAAYNIVIVNIAALEKKVQKTTL